MRRLATLGLLLVSGASFAQTGTTYTESEPNSTRSTANSFNLRGDLNSPNTIDRVVGVATGEDVDRYRLSSFPNQLSSVSLYTDKVGSQGIYGRSLTAAETVDTTSDVLLQPGTVSGSGMLNQFASIGSFSVDAGISNTGSSLYTTRLTNSYGFGSAGNNGGGGSLGSFQGSKITITAGSQTIDSDIVLVGRRSGSEPYRFLGANNDAGPDTLGSRIVANDLEILPDSYIVYLSDSNLATSVLPDANEFARNPADPRTALLDPSSLMVPTSSATVSIPITISDEYGRSITATYNKTGYGMAAFFFNVRPAPPVPEPATMAALGLGTLALLKRRRKSA